MQAISKPLLFAAAVGVSLAAAIPQSRATAPDIRLQSSQSYAEGNTVQAYRVPVVVNGVAKYYDITIALTANAAGVPATASVTSVLTPAITTGSVVPGIYRSGTATCTVTNITLSNGRIQSFFTCTVGAAISTLSVSSGLINATHPFFDELHLFSEDSRQDSSTYIWGLVSTNAQNLNGCYFAQGYPVGMKTDGHVLIADSFYGPTGGYYCSTAFVKQ